MAILLTGLLAGGVTCAAVQGGLLAGLLARQRALSSSGGIARDGGPRRAEAEVGQESVVVKVPGWGAELVDDLTPVAGFLGGKVVSHVILGALLGGIGSVAQLAPQSRAVLQLVAGVVIVAFGLAQLRVPGFRRLVVSPPASWLRVVRVSSRSQAAFAPAVLGFATILIPCGVTLSMMALALTSGSWLNGAATMGLFVVGTGPLFTLIGYAAQKAAKGWRGRLGLATGAVLLAVGLHTLGGGLTILGVPTVDAVTSELTGAKPVIPDTSSVSSAADGTQTAVITVRPGSYSPGNVLVKAGVPTRLVFRSEGALGCERALVVPSLNVEKVLPPTGDTVIEAGTLPRGTIRYSCAMGMYSGLISVQ